MRKKKIAAPRNRRKNIETMKREEIRNVEPIGKIESIRPTFRRNWYGKKILTGLEVVIHRRKG